MRQLKYMFHVGNVSQSVLPKIDERRAIGQRSTNNSRGNTRDQDLLAVTDRANARSAINVRAAVIRACLPGVNRNTHAQRYLWRPFLFTKRRLKVAGCRHRIAGPLKNGEDAVAFPAFQNNCPAIRFDRLCYDLIMALKSDVRFFGMRFPGASRPFHVREEKSYRPNRAHSHRSNYENRLQSPQYRTTLPGPR